MRGERIKNQAIDPVVCLPIKGWPRKGHLLKDDTHLNSALKSPRSRVTFCSIYVKPLGLH